GKRHGEAHRKRKDRSGRPACPYRPKAADTSGASIPAGRRGSFAELSAAFRQSALPSKGFFPFLPFFIKSVQPLKATTMQRLHFHQAPFGRLKSLPPFLGIVGRKLREQVFQN